MRNIVEQYMINQLQTVNVSSQLFQILKTMEMASSDIGPLQIISDEHNLKMVSSDSAPKCKKYNNLILIVCLQE